MPLPASYSTVLDVMHRYPPIGSITAVQSSHVYDAIAQEQARIDGLLGGRYVTPFEPVPPLIEMIAGDLATLRIVETRVLLVQQTRNADEWTEPWRKSWELLQDIATGKIDLVTGSGTIIPQQGRAVGALWSNTMTSTPTFIGQDWTAVDRCRHSYWP